MLQLSTYFFYVHIGISDDAPYKCTCLDDAVGIGNEILASSSLCRLLLTLQQFSNFLKIAIPGGIRSRDPLPRKALLAASSFGCFHTWLQIYFAVYNRVLRNTCMLIFNRLDDTFPKSVIFLFAAEKVIFSPF
jgi:hypothetical protein